MLLVELGGKKWKMSVVILTRVPKSAMMVFYLILRYSIYIIYSTYLKFHSDDTISLKYFKVRPNTRTNTDTMFYKYQFSSSRVGIP